MNNKNDFTVSFYTDYFAKWVKREGVKDGYVLDSQEVHIENVETKDDLVVIDGYLTTRQDS